VQIQFKRVHERKQNIFFNHGHQKLLLRYWPDPRCFEFVLYRRPNLGSALWFLPKNLSKLKKISVYESVLTPKHPLSCLHSCYRLDHHSCFETLSSVSRNLAPWLCMSHSKKLKNHCSKWRFESSSIKRS